MPSARSAPLFGWGTSGPATLLHVLVQCSCGSADPWRRRRSREPSAAPSPTRCHPWGWRVHFQGNDTLRPFPLGISFLPSAWAVVDIILFCRLQQLVSAMTHRLPSLSRANRSRPGRWPSFVPPLDNAGRNNMLHILNVIAATRANRALRYSAFADESSVSALLDVPPPRPGS